jgi:hypothetical protein
MGRRATDKSESGRCGWPPAALSLPSLEALEALSRPGGGPVVQGALFPVVPDESREGRLRRLLALPGRTGAD